MADSKKKSVKKVEKKTVEKAKVSGKKNPEKLTCGCEKTIKVPTGGQVIQYFTLTPALPTRTGRGDWIFSEVGEQSDISLLTVQFNENNSPLERALERAVLVISMNNDADAKGTWRFALGGVATDHADEDPSNDVITEVIDNGFTLLIYVQVLAEENKEQLPFGFMASFTDAVTGVVSIYESQDPEIKPKRP